MVDGNRSTRRSNTLECRYAVLTAVMNDHKATPHNSARAGGEGFFLSRTFGKQRNTWCISCFPNCADEGNHPPSGRRRNCAVLPYIRGVLRGSPLPAHTWVNRAILHGAFFDSLPITTWPPDLLSKGIIAGQGAFVDRIYGIWDKM